MVWIVVGGLAGGLVTGILGGVAGGTLRGVSKGVLWSIVWGLVVGIIGGLVGGLLVFVGISLVLFSSSEEYLPLIITMSLLAGVVSAVIVGIIVALGGMVGALRLYEYPFWFLWAGVLGLVDTAGRWLRWSPPFWNEVVALPVPGVGRQVRALLRRDSQAGLAAVQYLAAYRYGWARKVAARVALRFLRESMARARTLQDLAALYRELAPWWRLAPVRAQWGADLVEVLETVTKEAQAALESTTAQESTRHLQEALRAVEQAQQSLSRPVGRALARALQPVLETWQALLRGAVV